MIDDPIIEELHRTKDLLGAQFSGRPHALFESLRETQGNGGQAVVVLEAVISPSVAGRSTSSDEPTTAPRT